MSVRGTGWPLSSSGSLQVPQVTLIDLCATAKAIARHTHQIPAGDPRGAYLNFSLAVMPHISFFAHCPLTAGAACVRVPHLDLNCTVKGLNPFSGRDVLRVFHSETTSSEEYGS